MHNNKLFPCWTDANQQRLQLMSSSDHGRTWHSKRAIAEESSIAAPAIASYEGLLVVAWAAPTAPAHSASRPPTTRVEPGTKSHCRSGALPDPASRGTQATQVSPIC